LEAQIDSAIEAITDSAYFAQEARRAFGLTGRTSGLPPDRDNKRDPEVRLVEAVVALARATEADQVDDPACEQYLEQAQRAIGR
jgi:hypothetical protein